MLNDRLEISKDTIVIIPAYNEEKSISLVLNDLPKERLLEIIVVDNNSDDKTASVAKDNFAHVVFEKNKGYGQACLTGIEHALKKSPEYIIFLDGDYSDYPEDINLIHNQLDKGFDFVLASRMINPLSRMSLLPQARFGNKLATVLTKILFGGKTYTDLGPFRGIKADCLRRINMCDTNFGWTIEMQVKAIMHNLSYTEVSARYRKRVGVSKITGTFSGTIKAGYKIIYTIFKYRIKSLFSLIKRDGL